MDIIKLKIRVTHSQRPSGKKEKKRKITNRCSNKWFTWKKTAKKTKL